MGDLYALPVILPGEEELPTARSSAVKKVPCAELGRPEKKSTDGTRRFSSVDVKLAQLFIAFRVLKGFGNVGVAVPIEKDHSKEL